MAKIDIISGFLGAGKTTLIKKLIGEALADEQIVLIENEFGEIGIDGGFLKDSGIEITEMNSGCICCSLVGDFGTALKEVIDRYSPDRIIIEPSGVGKLSDVIKAVLDVGEHADITLNSAVTVADCSKAKMYIKNFGEFYNNQIESANTIILSRTQNVTEDKLKECVSLIKGLNANASVVTTPWDTISASTILGAMERTDVLDNLIDELIKEHKHEHGHCHHHDGDTCNCHHHEHEHEHEHHHHGHHHADDVFTSWGVETPNTYTKGSVENILSTLSDTSDYGFILRAKGIVPMDDGEWLHFDFTPGEYEVRHGAGDYTGRICVIGTDIDEAGLRKLFCID